MRHAHWLVPLLVLVLLASRAAPFASAQASVITVTLTPRSGSSESGTARLTDLGSGKTRVEVALTPAQGDHPMHIHEGTCANSNPAPKYALANVQNGASLTEVNASLSDLTQAPMAINVHKSVQDIATIAVCGDIRVPSTSAPGDGRSENRAAPDVSVLAPGGEPNLPVLPLALLALGASGLFLRRLGRRPR